jgi:hypothetical protein
MTVLHRHLARLVVAALAATAGLVGLGAPPASAALCGGQGISVVVDYGSLGGGTATGCDSKGAQRGSARDVFKAVGVILADAPREPGYVCQVNGNPGDGNCQGTDAYWGLFWSDGKNGRWVYSTIGVGGLKVPEGGSVAFAWQSTENKREPGVSPARSTPKPTPKPTPAPPKNTQKPAPTQGTGGVGGTGGTKPGATSTPTKVAVVPQATSAASATPTPSAPVSASAAASASASAAAASATATVSPTGSASPSPAIAADADGAFKPVSESSGLPVWVPVVVILVLALAAWVGLWWRNRSGEA